MSSATIKRGAQRPKVSRKRKAAPKRPSVFARVLKLLPFGQETVQRYAGYGVVALAVLLAGTAATLAGLPQAATVAAAEMTGRAGFRLERIELTGVDRMERLTIYAIAAEQNGRPIALIDLDKIRDDLMVHGWIAEARVSRRLPNTLVVDITERTPKAIWQHAGALTLIDGAGVQLEPVALEAMPELPLVIGPAANEQVAGLDALLATAPNLQPMLAGASWIGKRRWDLRFQSGETLALPEGERESRAALTKFARLDGAERLLGRGFTRFDMRLKGRLFVRRPNGAKRIDEQDEQEGQNGTTTG